MKLKKLFSKRLLVFYLICFMTLLSAFNYQMGKLNNPNKKEDSEINLSEDDTYSNYLLNAPLFMAEDRGNAFETKAREGNQYRNLFADNFTLNGTSEVMAETTARTHPNFYSYGLTQTHMRFDETESFQGDYGYDTFEFKDEARKEGVNFETFKSFLDYRYNESKGSNVYENHTFSHHNHSNSNFYGVKGFDNEIPNEFPSDDEFSDRSGGDCVVFVRDNYAGYDKVLQVENKVAFNHAGFSLDWTAKAESKNGTFEFWYRTNREDRDTDGWLTNENGEVLLYFAVKGLNDFKFGYAGGDLIIHDVIVERNKWYHVRIDWNFGAGTYNGLKNMSAELTINGTMNEFPMSDGVKNYFFGKNVVIGGFYQDLRNAHYQYANWYDSISYTNDISKYYIRDMNTRYNFTLNEYKIASNPLDLANTLNQSYSFDDIINLSKSYDYMNYTIEMNVFTSRNCTLELYAYNVSEGGFFLFNESFVGNNKTAYYNRTLSNFDLINSSNRITFYAMAWRNESNKLHNFSCIFNLTVRFNFGMINDTWSFFFYSVPLCLPSYRDFINMSQLDWSFTFYANLTETINFSMFAFTNLSWFSLKTSTSASSYDYNEFFIYNNISDYLDEQNRTLFVFEVSEINAISLLLYFSETYNGVSFFDNNADLKWYGFQREYYVQVFTMYQYSFAGTPKYKRVYQFEVHKDWTDWSYAVYYWGGSGWVAPSYPISHKVDNKYPALDDLELQFHVRYGLNDKNQMKVLTYFTIAINYNNTLAFNTIHEFNDEGYNYFDLTYSYRQECSLYALGHPKNFTQFYALRGIRQLVGGREHCYNRFFEIPFFNDDIDVAGSVDYVYPDVEDEDKPRPPTKYYWKFTNYEVVYDDVVYETIELECDYQVIDIDTLRVDYEFKTIEGHAFSDRYYYNPSYLKHSSLGNWRLKIGEWKVSLNFLRNVVCDILNIVLLVLQFFLFCLFWCVILVWYLICYYILPFLWNYIVLWIFYWCVYIFMYVVYLVILGLDYLILALEWIWENLLIPFFEWFVEDGLPLIIEVVVVVIAFILALIIWLATLCQGDFDEIYDQTYTLVSEIADFIIESITILIENLPALILYIVMYVLLILYCLLKHIYCKGKGYVNRSTQLKESYTVYAYPFVWAKNLIIYLKELILRWT